jgi:hypothetical protein
MNVESVNWLPENVLVENKRASVSMYKFLESDFMTCLEYVDLKTQHLSVYSFRLANLILRIGPELLRLLNIILFDPGRPNSFTAHTLKPMLIELQNRCSKRKDSLMDYYKVLPIIQIGIFAQAVKVTQLDKYILPFEVELRGKRQIIPWWEDGYNALKHRVIYEFGKSATLRNALYSLSALWLLHYEFSRNTFHSFHSEIFEKTDYASSNDVKMTGLLSCTN